MQREYHIGSVSVTKIFELPLNDFGVFQLFPTLAPDAFEQQPQWLDPTVMDVQHLKPLLSVHSWLVRTGTHTLLIDTGAGNDKRRPGLTVLDHLHTSYLQRLAECGVVPEDISHVLLTHVHADHVGWNTRLQHSTWVPTFPNATYVFSQLEQQYGAALAAGDEKTRQHCLSEAGMGQPVKRPTPGVYADSIQPLLERNRCQLIDVNGFEVLPGMRFRSAAGHSIDHAVIELEADGERAVFGGDLLHHPLEIYQPELDSMFCEFPQQARRARRQLLEELADSHTLYFSSHFPSTSAGYITRKGQTFDWTFA